MPALPEVGGGLGLCSEKGTYSACLSVTMPCCPPPGEGSTYPWPNPGQGMGLEFFSGKQGRDLVRLGCVGPREGRAVFCAWKVALGRAAPRPSGPPPPRGSRWRGRARLFRSRWLWRLCRPLSVCTVTGVVTEEGPRMLETPGRPPLQVEAVEACTSQLLGGRKKQLTI